MGPVVIENHVDWSLTVWIGPGSGHMKDEFGDIQLIGRPSKHKLRALDALTNGSEYCHTLDSFIILLSFYGQISIHPCSWAAAPALYGALIDVD